MKRYAGVAAAAAIVATVPQAAAGAVFEPTGKWVVNFDQAQCVASREYGSAAQPLQLVFKAPVTGAVVQMAVVRNDKPLAYAEQVDGKVQFGDGPAQKLSALLFTPPKSGRRLFLFNLQRADVAGWTAGGALIVEAGKGLRENFRLPDMAPMLKVMDECVADLRQHWNFSEGPASPKLKQRAKAALARYFDPADYPQVALSARQQGLVQAVVLVNEQGRVADCTLVQASGVAALDAQTCVVIQSRARYTPAIGFDGKPAKDVDSARINWLAR